MHDKATYVRIETLPLDRLQPFPGNAKIGNVPKILESLARNGQYRSLVVREHDGGTLTVLAGNHTLQALAAHGPGDCGMTTRHGDTERPCAVCGNEPWDPVARCEIVTCDDDTATRINLVDNKSAADGTWDELALASLIEGLDGDTTGTGYDDADIDQLVTALDVAIDDADLYDEDDEDDDEQDQAPEQPAAAAPVSANGTGEQQPAPGGSLSTAATPVSSDAASGLVPAFSHERVPMVLHYSQADRDEAGRLVTAARDLFPADETPAIVLRSLRTLVAVLDSRHSPDGAVTVAALLRAAGADQ
jgi:ParB-like chromosome segregation protein Spo0J